MLVQLSVRDYWSSSWDPGSVNEQGVQDPPTLPQRRIAGAAGRLEHETPLRRLQRYRWRNNGVSFLPLRRFSRRRSGSLWSIER